MSGTLWYCISLDQVIDHNASQLLTSQDPWQVEHHYTSFPVAQACVWHVLTLDFKATVRVLLAASLASFVAMGLTEEWKDPLGATPTSTVL